jgi:carbon monoxide dehydrogenase subunit G
MGQIETSILVRRPRQVVFDFLFDFEHTGGIDPGIQQIEKKSVGPTGVGTEFAVRQRVPPFGRIADGISRFTAVDSPTTIVIEAELGSMRPIGRFELKDVDGGTLLDVAVDPNPVGVFRILTPLIARKARRLWEARLRRMKRILESSP